MLVLSNINIAENLRDKSPGDSHATLNGIAV